MSHFTVVVIGEKVEEQLAKYNENLEGPERWEPIRDYTIEAAEKGLGLEALANPTLEHLEQLLKWLQDDDTDEKYRIRDGQICRATTYNPDSQWDWYVVGGRWAGFFPLKKGKKLADSALKKNIDFEGARKKSRTTAEEAWVPWAEATAKFGMPESWDVIRERYVDDVEKARDVFHAHGAVKACRDLVGFMTDPVEHFGSDKETYVRRSVGQSLTPYAIVKDGEWFQKGKMGWFGMSSDEIGQDDWNAFVNKTYDELPDDTLLTLVDCHI
jgi:hypothetical protein